MKVSFLLIILGFSQVLGRNHESLTESKYEREDQVDLAPSDIVKKVLCEGFCYFMSCECNEDQNEYDNSMDYFNAKSDEVQIENEDKIIELEEMVSNNLVDPKTECEVDGGMFSTDCSNDNDCKQCSDKCSKKSKRAYPYCDLTTQMCDCALYI